MTFENTKTERVAFIIRFRNGNFLSLLDIETPNDYEALVFLIEADALKHLNTVCSDNSAAVVMATLDEYFCPSYTPPPAFVLVRSLTSLDISPATYPYLFIAPAGQRTSDIDSALVFSSVNAAYLAKADYQFSDGYYVAEVGKLDEVAPREL